MACALEASLFLAREARDFNTINLLVKVRKMVWDLGFRVGGLGLRVCGLGLRPCNLRLRLSGLGRQAISCEGS